MQTTSHLLMIRPVNFSFNTETAVNNAFQISNSGNNVQQQARIEFDNLVALLRSKDIDVMVVDDTPEPYTPDSIFPNNWVSFHHDGKVVLYPMFAPNRRMERKPGVLEKVRDRFLVNDSIDLSRFESEDRFLEGTGSMVLDRENKIAYACLSPRTDPELLDEFCRTMEYHPVEFNAFDGKGWPIYHTNVIMCVADRYVVMCLECVPDPEQKQQLIDRFRSTDKQLIEISFDQVKHFAGNMLQIQNGQGKKFLVMSSQAFESLTTSQIEELAKYNEILHAPLGVIEANGGGSARCMIAEIHLPARK